MVNEIKKKKKGTVNRPTFGTRESVMNLNELVT